MADNIARGLALGAKSLAALPKTSALSLPKRTLSVGCIGDSIVRNQMTQLTGNQAQVGVTMGFTSRSWAQFACLISGRRLKLNQYAVEGYSGFRTEQIADAMLPASMTIPWGQARDQNIPYGVLACAPDICFDCSGTNDIGASATFSTIQTMLDGKRKIWDRLLSNGILPVVISMMPRSAPASYAALVPTWNAAVSALAAKWGIPFIDVYTATAAADGTWMPGYTYINGAPDAAGLHPGGQGAIAIAKAIWTQLSPALGIGKASTLLYSDTSSLTSGNQQAVASAAVTAGGTGYNVGDCLQLANNNINSAHTPAVLKVTTVNAGAVTAVTVLTGGNYPAAPAVPTGVAQVYQYGNPLNAGGAGTGATFTLTMTANLFDSRKGDCILGPANLFPTTAGWTPRYDPNVAATMSVATGGIAQYGKELTATIAAPASASNYVDFNGNAITVGGGDVVAFFGRMKYTAGSPSDYVDIGIQGTTTAGALLASFGAPGEAGSSSTAAGGSLQECDFYLETKVPSDVTTVRPWIVTYTYPGAGAVLKLAQVGFAKVA